MFNSDAGESAHSIAGVSGRMFWGRKPGATLWTTGKWISESRKVAGKLQGYGPGAFLKVEVRFDDSCGNRHQSFAVTGTIRDPAVRGDGGFVAGGCLHDEVEAVFPELAHLIRWHLCDTSGPMHGVANAIWHAGDRDCHGKRAGEPWAWESCVTFGSNPIRHKLKDSFAAFLQAAAPADINGDTFPGLAVVAVPYVPSKSGSDYKFGPKYTFTGYGGGEWHKSPFDTKEGAENFLSALRYNMPTFGKVPTLFSEGKARDFAAARSCAVWPEATDADLMQEPEALKAALLARLPGLLAAMRADVEGAGFDWKEESES